MAEEIDEFGIPKKKSHSSSSPKEVVDDFGIPVKKKLSGSDVSSTSVPSSSGGSSAQASLPQFKDPAFSQDTDVAVPFLSQADKDAELLRQHNSFVAENTPGKISLSDPSVKGNALSPKIDTFTAAVRNGIPVSGTKGVINNAKKAGAVNKDKPKEGRGLVTEIAEGLYLPAITKGFSDLVIKPLAGGTDFIDRSIDKIYTGLTGEETPSWLRKGGAFHTLSGIFDKGYEERDKPTNIVSEIAESVAGTLPMIAALATGGGEAKLATQAPEFVSGLTKLLATTKAASSYEEATANNKGYLESLTLAGVGAGEGALEGLTLEAQMLVGGALGKGVANKLAEKGLFRGGKATEAVLHALGIGTVFGGTSAASDLANGREINVREAGKQFGMGLAFEVVPVVRALNKEVRNKLSGRQPLSDIEASSAGDALQAEAVSSAASNLNAESAIRTLTDTPIESLLATNADVKKTRDDLYAESIEAGAKAYEETDSVKKKELYAQQLELKQQGDVKLISDKVKENPADFIETITNSEELSPEVKAQMVDKITALSEQKSPELPDSDLTIPEIDNRVRELDARVEEIQSSSDTGNVISNPSSVEYLIQTIDERTDLQLEALNKGTNESINSQENIKPFETPEILQPEPAAGDSIPASDVQNSGLGNVDSTIQVSEPATDFGTSELDGTEQASGFAYRSQELGDINISSNENGSYDVTYSDGVTVPMEAQDLRDFLGFDVTKIDAPEQDARLYGTDNPREIANIYDERVRELEDGSPEGAIAEYGPRTSAEEFSRVSDANNINQLMRLNYFKGGENVKEIGLDIQAQEINDRYFNGADVVSPEMIADFMISYPKGEATFKTGTGDNRLAEINDRYRELTGRDLNRQDARRISNELTRESISSDVDDDVPFQRSEGDTLAPEQVRAAQEVLERAFPNIETNFHETVEDFVAAAAENGIDTVADNAPNAFVGRDGIIHFNPEKINADTQLHEYGHILTRWAKENSPKLWDRMQQLGSEQLDIHDELKANGYKLRGSRLSEEAFVTLLGREGAGAKDSALRSVEGKNVVRRTINEIWTKFQRYILEKTGFDVSKFRNIRNMGIADFMETLNDKYLNSGVEISRISSEDIAGDVSEQKARPIRQPGESISAYANRLLEWTRDYKNEEGSLPLRNLKTNLKPVRENLREIRMSYREGYKNAQADTKTAFLEYDRYQKQIAKEAVLRERNSNKEKFGEYDRDMRDRQQKKLASLRERYETKLAEEKLARQKQVQVTKDLYKGIRAEIKGIITDLNKSGAFGRVKFTDKELLSFANQLNNVKTERGLDKFRDFVARVVKNVDVMRDVQDSRVLLKDVKKLLKAEYVTQNIKTLIRDLATLNPYTVQDTKEFKAILEDLSKGQRSKEFSVKTEKEIYEFIAKEKDADLQGRITDTIDTLSDISNSEAHQSMNSQAVTKLPLEYELRKMLGDIYNDPDLTFNEKVKKVNIINDALDVYDRQANDAYDKSTGQVTGQPEDFNKILDDLENPEADIKEKHRDILEDVARSRQDLIDEADVNLTPEQRESLGILKNTNLVGQDANTLRLFNNILENVSLNNDHSGIGIFEAKAIGNSKEGALKLVDYLESIGREAKDGRFKTKAGEMRAIGASLSIMLSRIANNDFTFLSKLNTGTHFDEIRNGFAQVKQRYDQVLSRKLEQVFKDHPDVARNPESIQRLSLFSFMNQTREFSSPEQQSSELIRRIGIMLRDVELKSSEGLKRDNQEAQIEQYLIDGIADKIKSETGLDITVPEELAELSYKDYSKIDFLNAGEKAVYDTYRQADDSLRAEHESIVKRNLNEPYETWSNHMRDGYRLLGSGLVDVVAGEELGFTATNQNTSNGSNASLQRVKGDPLSKKSGEKQRVLNLNFFDVQNQNIKDILFDIHTLRPRMIFDEALKNPRLRDALGNENHQLYKNSIRESVLSEMGLNSSIGEKELRVIKQGLNLITKAGTFKQLLSVTAFIKQGGATIFNTLGNTLDPKTMYQAAQVLGTDAVKSLISKHPISERGDNVASLNTLRQEGIADVDNTVVSTKDKSMVENAMESANDFVNKYFLQLEKNGTTTERWITKPIKYGDVKTGEWAWVTYYAKNLMDRGVVKDFESIDWDAQSATPDREAADFAENMSSKQLNENQKSARSKLINSSSFGLMAAKTLLFPFGSFNMHKMQGLVENMRTLAAKDTFVDAEYRKNNASAAAKSLLGGFVEETMFSGMKLGLSYGLAKFAQGGLTYILGSLFGTEEEQKENAEKLEVKLQQKRDNFVQQWYTNAIGNYFFGGLGGGPQSVMTNGINDLTNSQFFFEPNLSISQKIEDANNYGMYGAAFNGMFDLSKDVYRMFDNTDKYGVPVNITPYQKSVFAFSAMSNMLSYAGLNDADLNRTIDAMRKQVERGLSKSFHEPNYTDLSQPTPLKIAGKEVKLSPEHLEFYEQIKLPMQQKLEAKGVSSKQAASRAASIAKARMLEKFGYKKILSEGQEIKKKK